MNTCFFATLENEIRNGVERSVSLAFDSFSIQLSEYIAKEFNLNADDVKNVVLKFNSSPKTIISNVIGSSARATRVSEKKDTPIVFPISIEEQHGEYFIDDIPKTHPARVVLKTFSKIKRASHFKFSYGDRTNVWVFSETEMREIAGFMDEYNIEYTSNSREFKKSIEEKQKKEKPIEKKERLVEKKPIEKQKEKPIEKKKERLVEKIAEKEPSTDISAMLTNAVMSTLTENEAVCTKKPKVRISKEEFFYWIAVQNEGTVDMNQHDQVLAAITKSNPSTILTVEDCNYIHSNYSAMLGIYGIPSIVEKKKVLKKAIIRKRSDGVLWVDPDMFVCEIVNKKAIVTGMIIDGVPKYSLTPQQKKQAEDRGFKTK